VPEEIALARAYGVPVQNVIKALESYTELGSSVVVEDVEDDLAPKRKFALEE